MSGKADLKNKISFHEFLNPDEVYIPFDETYDLLITNNQYLYKGQKLAGKGNSYIYSPVSGNVMGTKTCITCDGLSHKCIAILNDFKEKTGRKAGIKRFDKNWNRNELINLLQNKNIVSTNYADLNLGTFFASKENSTTIIVSSIELDNNSFTNSFILKDNMLPLLDTIDFLSNILNIKSIILTVPDSDTDNITKISELLGTYPKIHLKIIKGEYPNGLEIMVKKNICPNIPDDKILFLNIRDVLGIYNAVIRNKDVSECYLTITGDAILEPIVINVKIGSAIEGIIKSFIKMKIDNPLFLVNSSIGSKEIDIKNLIVSSTLGTLIINVPSKINTQECLNCGKCHEICPVGINPKYIKDNIDNPDKLKIAKIDRCIDCGLCTHVCSANINLKAYLDKRFDYEN